MSAPFQFDVFLSHNSKDKPRVRKLAERLKGAGLRVWLDEWVIQPGDIISLKVDDGLEQSRVMLLCLSPAALASDWVALERSTSIHRDPANAGRRFIPLLLADCNLPDTLRRYKYIDFREEANEAFEELLAACGLNKESGPVGATDSGNLRGRPEIAVIFERSPRFPKLEFSLSNNSHNAVQVSSMRAITLATEHYDDPGMSYYLAPVSELNCTVCEAGNESRIFGENAVCNLAPGEMERFRVTVDCQFTIALLDLELEFISAGQSKSTLQMPEQVILVGCSEQESYRPPGQLILVPRSAILDVITGKTKLDLRLHTSPNELLIKAAPRLCPDNIENSWKQWVTRLADTEWFGEVLLSFAKVFDSKEIPDFMLSGIYAWISDANNLHKQKTRQPPSVALLALVASNLERLHQKIDKVSFILDHLDKTLEVAITGPLASHRSGVLEQVCTNVGAVEYLIAVMQAVPQQTSAIHRLLRDIMEKNQSTPPAVLESVARLSFESDSAKETFWNAWWESHKEEAIYSCLPWRELSPRLLAKLG